MIEPERRMPFERFRTSAIQRFSICVCKKLGLGTCLVQVKLSFQPLSLSPLKVLDHQAAELQPFPPELSYKQPPVGLKLLYLLKNRSFGFPIAPTFRFFGKRKNDPSMLIRCIGPNIGGPRLARTGSPHHKRRFL